jgi:hypothetical protein
VSEPKRYHLVTNRFGESEMRPSDDCLGCSEMAEEQEYIRYEDYARLKAEVERLTDKIRVSDNHAQCLEFVINSGTANELRLQAQVERLTKAGDAMVDMVDWEVPYERRKKLEAAWNAAKEGKGQP